MFREDILDRQRFLSISQAARIPVGVNVADALRFDSRVAQSAAKRLSQRFPVVVKIGRENGISGGGITRQLRANRSVPGAGMAELFENQV